MASLVVFGTYLTDLDLEEDDAAALLAGPIHKMGDDSAGLALARIYGVRGGGVCINLPKPIVTWMPTVSAPANDCGYSSPSRAWVIHEDEVKAATTSPLDAKADGIFIGIEDFRVEDGWLRGTVRLKVVAAGIKLLDVGLPFKTKNDAVLVDTEIAGFKVKAILTVESVDPPRVCVTVTIKGPLGYKDKKKVCT